MKEHATVTTEKEIELLAKKLDLDGDGRVSARDFFECLFGCGV